MYTLKDYIKTDGVEQCFYEAVTVCIYRKEFLLGSSTLIVFAPKGGCWVTTGNAASRFTRDTFRRHFHQHLGFRLACSTNSLPVRLCNVEVFGLGEGVLGKY